MSRTFRTKCLEKRRNYPYFIGPTYFDNMNDLELMKYYRKCIGDKNTGERNAPSWYCRILKRQHRAKNKAILKNSIVTNTDAVMIPVKKTANYNWF